MQEILFKISICKNGFLLENYLRSRKFINPYTKIIGSYSKDESPSTIDEKISNKELYQRLIELRTQIRKETSLPNYMIFNNASIKNLCTYLPLTLDELVQVKGFKKTKADVYGDKIISIVKGFCKQNNIEPSQKVTTDQTESTYSVKSNSVLETVRLLHEGKNIEEIAKERELVPDTIESHLAQAIRKNLILIDEVIPIDEVHKLAEYFPKELNEVRLASIKEKVHEDVTYGKLRMVLVWLQKDKN